MITRYSMALSLLCVLLILSFICSFALDMRDDGALSAPKADASAKNNDNLVAAINLFFDANPTTSPEEILKERPQAEYHEEEFDEEDVPSFEAVTTFLDFSKTSKIRFMESYLFRDRRFTGGYIAVVGRKDKGPARCFVEHVLQRLSMSGVCTNMHYRPKGLKMRLLNYIGLKINSPREPFRDTSAPDILLDWQCGDTVFLLKMDAVYCPNENRVRYGAILTTSETSKEELGSRLTFEDGKPLTNPAAALAAWGVSMPTGWNPEKDMQKVGAW